MRAALAELVRREVLTVSADPLSPERGSYRFAQHMLRQVAYDTLSRRDRKARHLKVAAHLRAAFPGDGEEVADVIARHYLDALDAVPDDPDAAEIRGQAIGALIRAAERAERTGAPAPRRRQLRRGRRADRRPPRRGSSHGRPRRGCCGNAPPKPPTPAPTRPRPSSRRAGPASTTCRRGQARAAARAQAIAGQALRRWGRHAEAREQLTAALEVLRADPDTDTVRALGDLAALEVFAGSPDADRLSAEALTLGQALGVGDRELSGLFGTRGIYLSFTDRRPEAAAYFRESARLADQAGDSMRLGRALLNLADMLAGTDPAAAAETARDRRRAPAPGRRPGLPGRRDRQPGPGAADARRLGRRRGRTHPGRGLRRRWPTTSTSPATGAGWRRCAATPPPPRPCWPGWRTCGPAKISRTRR